MTPKSHHLLIHEPFISFSIPHQKQLSMNEITCANEKQGKLLTVP